MSSKGSILNSMIPHLQKIDESYKKLESHIIKRRAIDYFEVYCKDSPDQRVTYEWGIQLMGYGAEVTHAHLLTLTGMEEYTEVLEAYRGKFLSDVLLIHKNP